MYVKKALLFILLILDLIGCTPSYEFIDPADQDLAFLDIVDAQQLFIGSGAISKSVKGASDRLFKITDYGYVEELRHIDEDGNEIIVRLNPVAIYNVNETYVVVCFGHDINWVESGYLIRKSDGAVFSLGDEGFPEHFYNTYENPEYVSADKYGNIYFRGTLKEEIGNFPVLLKINTENPEHLTREVYSAPTDIVSHFVVDLAGNVIYTGGLRDHSTWGTVRLKKLNGGFYNLPVWANYWIGLDGNAYFCTETRDENDLISYIIQKVTVDESFNVIISEYGVISNMPPPLGGGCFKLSLQGRIISFSIGGNAHIEVHNPTGTPRVISTLPRFLTIRAVDASESYYYIAGYDLNLQNVVLRVDPIDDSYTYLLNSGEYEIHKISVSASDVITFSGLRFADGKMIIGEIDVDGTLTVLDEEHDVTVVSLERIR